MKKLANVKTTITKAMAFIAVTAILFSSLLVLPPTSMTVSAATTFENSIDTVIILNDTDNPDTKTDDGRILGHTAIIVCSGATNEARYYSFGPKGKIGSGAGIGMVYFNKPVDGCVSYESMTHSKLVSRLRKSGSTGYFGESVYANGKLIESRNSCPYDRYLVISVTPSQGQKILNYCEDKKTNTPQYVLKYSSASNPNYQCDTFISKAFAAGGITYDAKTTTAKKAGKTGTTAFPNESFSQFAKTTKISNAGVKYVLDDEPLWLAPAYSQREVTSSSLVVRSWMNNVSDIWDTLSKGFRVEVKQTIINGAGEHWVLISYFRYNRHCSGYVNAAYLKFV